MTVVLVVDVVEVLLMNVDASRIIEYQSKFEENIKMKLLDHALLLVVVVVVVAIEEFKDYIV